MEQMDIAIATDGQVAVTVKGVKGKSCTLVSKAIEDALGSVVEDAKTKEYFEAPKQAQKEQR